MLNYKKPAFWVIAAVVVLCGIAAVCFLTDPKTPAEDKRLRQTYPQYFDLDAANGLDVYVWQMAPDSYDFGLLPHSDIPRDAFDKDMLDLRGTSAEEMRHILSAYTVGKNDIYIIPWNVPFSSYIAYPWSIELEDGVNIEEVNDEKIFEEALEDYRKTIEKMLWGDGK